MNKFSMFLTFGTFSFIAIIAIICRLYPQFVIPTATVSSWFRGLEKNKFYNGLPNSWHLIGWAVDIVPARQEYIEKLRPWFNDIIIHDMGSGEHIHAEFDLKKYIKSWLS